MSSVYRLICLSHDPGIVTETEWSNSAEAIDAATEPPVEHASCDLVVGRYSYPLIEVCCPRGYPETRQEAGRGRRHSGHTGYHRDDIWTDAGWLRLLAASTPEVRDKAPGLPNCWPYDRAVRLRIELEIDAPAGNG